MVGANAKCRDRTRYDLREMGLFFSVRTVRSEGTDGVVLRFFSNFFCQIEGTSGKACFQVP